MSMETIDLQGLDPDLEPDAEKLHRLSRIGLGAVPLLGGALVEIFTSVIESPLNKRRTETIIQIGGVVNSLIERGVVTEDGLRDNEAFVSTVAEVCSISLRNHQKEKLAALKNAVENSALPSCPGDDYRQIFLSFIDSCTVTQIKILEWLDDPAKSFENLETGDPEQYIALQDLAPFFAVPDADYEFYLINLQDLYKRGLVMTDNWGEQLSCDQLRAGLTTNLGKKLVAFITAA